jgi:hypothetical protein
MDNLITHLEKTLNDDECVQEALLLLKNLEKVPTASENSTTHKHQTNSNHDSESIIFGNDFKDPVNSELVALYGLTSFLKNDFEIPNELPLRIVAFRLNISFQQLREICRSSNETIEWSSSFFNLCQQIIVCFENKINVATGNERTLSPDTSKETVKNLKREIEHVKSKTQRGTGVDHCP